MPPKAEDYSEALLYGASSLAGVYFFPAGVKVSAFFGGETNWEADAVYGLACGFSTGP